MDDVEIVLVEDNEDDAELIMNALKMNKVSNKIVHLRDGEEGLDFMFGRNQYKGRNIAIKPRVILLDIKMPKINGLEFLAIIKQEEEFKHIPIVILTSSKEDLDIKKAYSLGVNSYIVKPVNFNNFVNTVSSAGYYWLLINQDSNNTLTSNNGR